MRLLRNSILFLILAAPASAQSRLWISADGQRTFRGELIAHDGTLVTIVREDGEKLKFEMSKLHETDRKWIIGQFPDGVVQPKQESSTGVFDTLQFGDSRDEVFKKLKASKTVELVVEEKFLGRFGLNGMFRTRAAVGGMQCALFFDWNSAGGMQEITLQSDSLAASAFESKLTPCWREYCEVLTQLHGRPAQTNALAKPDSLEDGGMLASHLWRLEEGGSVLLGIAREGENYQIVVRITRENVKPVVIPGAAVPIPPQVFQP